MVLRAPSLRRHQRRQVSTKLYAKDARTHGCPGSRWRVVLVPAPAEEHSAQSFDEIESDGTRRAEADLQIRLSAAPSETHEVLNVYLQV